MTNPDQPSLDELAELAADRIRAGLEDGLDLTQGVIREALEAAAQAQRDTASYYEPAPTSDSPLRSAYTLEMARLTDSRDQWKARAEELEQQLEAQREQLEQQKRQLTSALAHLAAIDAELPQPVSIEESYSSRVRVLKQQLSHVTQDTRAMMLAAWIAGYDTALDTPTLEHDDRLAEQVSDVDRLLAEHKAQQSCATPTKSSPPARVVDAPSSAGG